MTHEFNLSFATDTISYQTRCKYPQGFYIISTPIGNLEDITLRALSALNNADIIVCEDTRVTKKLLTYYCINKPLLTYNDNKNHKDRDNIVNLLKQGKTLAYVSDAGMPLISDPGYKLVQEIIKSKIYITCIPGASACLTALVLSGLPSDKFIFMGFMPRKITLITDAVRHIPTNVTAIFYESAQRINRTLEYLSSIKEVTKICIARELTKKFEQILYGSIEELQTKLQNVTLKGEIVLLLYKTIEHKEEDIEKLLQQELKSCSTKTAVKNVVNITGFSRSLVYSKALEIKKNND